MLNKTLPPAPIQDKNGSLTFNQAGHTFTVNVENYDERKQCLEELEARTGKKFAWCQECFGLNHWVLYDTDMYYLDVSALQYKDGCGLAPTIPINATNCQSMFVYCNDVDLSQFNTENIVDMTGMFFHYNGAKLDVSMLDTSKVENFNDMFSNCVNLKTLDVSNFSTVNALSMERMFYNCSSLRYLDLTSFSTENVGTVSMMFWNCRELLGVDVSSFNTVNIGNMEEMFANCRKLLELDLTNFDLGSIMVATKMFYGCTILRKIKVSDKWRFGDSIEECDDMYKMCEVFADYNSDWSTKTLNYAQEDFGCLTLMQKGNSKPLAPVQDKDGNLIFKLSDVGDFSNLFSQDSSKDSSTNSLKDKTYTVNVLSEKSRNECIKELEKDTGNDFAWCKEREGLEHWVLYDKRMYTDDYTLKYNSNCGLAPVMPLNGTSCVDLFMSYEGEDLNLEKFYTNNVVSMYNMFRNCINIKKLDLSSFDTSKVEDMSYMFSHMCSLKELNVSSFNTEQLMQMSYMFESCGSLEQLDLRSFSTGAVIEMDYAFAGCDMLSTLCVSDKWVVGYDVSYYDSNTFDGCINLPGDGYDASTGYDSFYGGCLTVIKD